MYNFINKIKKKIFTVKDRIVRKFLNTEPYEVKYIGTEYVYDKQLASNLIMNLLDQEKPCFIGRFGTTELSVIDHFLKNKKPTCVFPENLKRNISTLSGFFPTSDDALIRFCSEAIACIKNIDALGIRSEVSESAYFDLEKKFVTTFSPNSKLFNIEELSPFFVENPWTEYLKNKKVLVIHPFEESIRNQYTKHNLIFNNPKILPEFDLKIIKAIQGLADSKNSLPFKSWFEALNYMYREIDKIDFDVAIIGAGAYGIFLADYCKRKGKKAICIGGAVQVLFGIKGKRWTDSEKWRNKIYNKHWIEPSINERPENYQKVERGCYW